MNDDVRQKVRARYGSAASAVVQGKGGGGCGCGCGTASSCCDPVTGDLYSEAQKRDLPEKAVLASLGCGNPTAIAPLHEGEVVLDLGSGGGIDVLLSARRVGPTGKAIGLDMTDEMLELARGNQADAGVTNAEFLKGEIENIPLPDESVDVIISNCVINLSADKPAAMAEAFRVLKPGGRLAISDIVTRGDIPAEIRRDMELWVGCIAGALDQEEFKEILLSVGFENPSVETTRIYELDAARQLLAGTDGPEVLARAVDGRITGAFVRATKPES